MAYLCCTTCGKRVSTETMPELVVRAALECPECLLTEARREDAMMARLRDALELAKTLTSQMHEMGNRIEALESENECLVPPVLARTQPNAERDGWAIAGAFILLVLTFVVSLLTGVLEWGN